MQAELTLFILGVDPVQTERVETLPSARVWLLRPSAAEVPAKVSAFEQFVIESLRARKLA